MLSLDEAVRFSVKLKSKSVINKADISNHFGINFFYGDTQSFLITVKSKTTSTSNLKKAIRNLQVFKIRELYNKHKDIVQEIIQSSLIYTDDYIQSLLDDYSGQLFRNREDVLRHLTRNYSSPLLMPNRPFSKLSKDIYQEFGITF